MQCGHRPGDVVLGAPERDLALLDDRVRRAWITVLRLADAPRVHDAGRSNRHLELNVGVTDQEQVDIDADHLALPEGRLRIEIAVQRIGRSCMDGQKPYVIESRPRPARQPAEVTALGGRNLGPPDRSGGVGEPAERRTAPRRDSLTESPVVIALHNHSRAFAHFAHAGAGLWAIRDDVTKAEQEVVRLGQDGPKGGVVAVDVGDDEGFHGVRPRDAEMARHRMRIVAMAQSWRMGISRAVTVRVDKNSCPARYQAKQESSTARCGGSRANSIAELSDLSLPRPGRSVKMLASVLVPRYHA